MKRSVQFLFSLALMLLVAAGTHVNAQSGSTKESRSISISTDENGKVTLKVTTKNGDDTKTFEKTYGSQEEMYDDPELEEYGINSDDWSFGGRGLRFGSPNANIFFHNGPGIRFWDDDEDGGKIFKFNFDIDSMMSQFGHGSPFAFRIGPNGQFDVDSLMQKFDFDFGKNGYFFNGDEFEDMESMMEELRERFSDMDFDFNIDDWDDQGSGLRAFRFGGSDDDDDPRVISRVRVFVRSARDADKEKVGADAMEDLQIKDISFYPNPSDGRFNLELLTGNDKPIHIKIVGPDGSVVYEKTSESVNGEYDFDIDISGEREGIYILQVIQNNSSLTKRIIIE